MIEPAGVRLELWDGSSSYAGTRDPIGDLLIGDRRTLVGLAFNPDVWFGESYMTGRLGVRGPLEPVIEALTANAPTSASVPPRVGVVPRRLTGGVRDRLRAAVSGAVRTARVATTDMDTG